MPAPRTTHTIRVRSYELRPGGRAGNASFLNWFQEAAFANSIALGFSPARYEAMALSWVMRESDLALYAAPGYAEPVAVTTWIAELKRARAQREYEARSADGTLLAHCSTQWVMLDLATQRPTRIPAEMFGVFDPALDFVLPPIAWPEVESAPFSGVQRVAFYEEDALAHVNNAIYLQWIEENARRAAEAAGQPAPHFLRHRLTYRQPAFKDDVLTLHSRCVPHADGLAWQHDICRDHQVLVEARSLSR